MSLEKMNWLPKLPEKVTRWVNGINQYLFILLILLFFFLRFNLNWNEEHYLQLAKQFYSPDWAGGTFSFTEFAGTRVLFQYFAGFLLSFLPFEAVTFVGRLLLCILIAFPLARLYKLLGLTNVFILLHLPVLFLFQGKHPFYIYSNQSFFGGEFIFTSVEPKTFAYIFVLFALYYLLIERYSMTALLLAFASYFHILVGGWVMVYFSLYYLWVSKSLKKTFLTGLLYVACLLPFLFYLAPLFKQNLGESASHEQIDWIFTYFKQPFHTAIFESMEYFLTVSFEGVLLSSFFFLMCLFIFPLNLNAYNLRINTFNIIVFTGTFLSLILAFFDKSGAFVKYFPFRINSLFCFLVFLQLTLLIQNFLVKKNTLTYLQFGVLLWFFVIIVPWQMLYTSKQSYLFLTGQEKDPPYASMCEYIKKNTPSDATVFFLPADGNHLNRYSFDGYQSMIRKMERDRFVYFYAAPISPDVEKTLEWYRRVQLKKSVLEDNNELCRLIGPEQVDYILADYELENGYCYSLLFQEGGYFLYEMKE